MLAPPAVNPGLQQPAGHLGLGLLHLSELSAPKLEERSVLSDATLGATEPKTFAGEVTHRLSRDLLDEYGF